MFDRYLIGTGIIIAGAFIWAARRYNDGLHPLIVVSPLLFYAYVYVPGSFRYHGSLTRIFTENQLETAGLVTMLGVLAFCIGIGHARARPREGSVRRSLFSLGFEAWDRSRVYRVGIALAVVGWVIYLYLIWTAGGFWEVYAQKKAYISAGSGYVTEAQNLVFPGALFVSIAFQGSRPRPEHFRTLVIIVLPQLLQGTLGGRRGPAFLAVLVLLCGWLIIRGRPPRVSHAILVVALAGGAVLFVWSQRGGLLRVGSGQDFQEESFMETLRPREATIADDYVTGAGTIIKAHRDEDFTWGRNFVDHLILRAIPSQLWSGKDELLDQIWGSGPGDELAYSEGWRADRGDELASSEMPENVDPLNWRAVGGSAIGFVADCFRSFSWAGLLVCYGVGWLYGWLWLKHRHIGAVWTIVYILALMVSVYLPTQALASATLYRLIMLGVPTLLLWRHFVEPTSGGPGVAPVGAQRSYSRQPLRHRSDHT